MAWSADLIEVVKRGGNVVATVRFSSGVESFTQEVTGDDLTPDSLAEFSERVCVSRETRDASFALFEPRHIGKIVLPRSKV